MPTRFTFTTRGGQVLRRFLGRVGTGAVDRRFREIALRELRRELLPELEYRVPKVSGRLSKSFTMRTDAQGAIGLFSNAPYANLVQFAQRNRSRALGKPNVPALANELVETRGASILRRAARQAVQEATQ